MLSLHFNENIWAYFVVDDTKVGEESILSEIYTLNDAEEAIKMYQRQVEESIAKLDDKIIYDVPWFAHSWRDEDCLGGE